MNRFSYVVAWQEPFYELQDWSFQDMEDFYERSRDWHNWSDVDFWEFKKWREVN